MKNNIILLRENDIKYNGERWELIIEVFVFLEVIIYELLIRRWKNKSMN